MRVQVCDISCLRKDPRRSFQRLDLFFHKIMLLLMMMMTTMMMIMHKVVGTGIGVHQNNFQYIRSETFHLSVRCCLVVCLYPIVRMMTI